MSLLKEWRDTAYSQEMDRGMLQNFWGTYFELEKNIYEQLLENPDEEVKGTVKELAEKYGVEVFTMTGFLDGINESLKVENPIEEMEEDTKVSLAFDKEKLYKGMVAAKAEWLYELPMWNDIFDEEMIKELYDIDNGFFDPLYGSIELPQPKGEPDTFVISSCGTGIPVYRKLQKENAPFIAGVLYTNDLDYELAKQLATEIIEEKPFCMLSDENVQKAKAAIDQCSRVINAGVEIGDCNQRLQEILDYAKQSGKLYNN